MKKHEAEKLIETIKGFIEPHDRKSLDVVAGNGGKASVETTQPGPVVSTPPAAGPRAEITNDDFNWLYQKIKAKLIDELQMDPVLLKLIMVQPEIIVEYERKVETIDTSSVRGRVVRLIAQGFFAESKTTGQVRSELARTGSDVNSGGLSTALGALRASGFLAGNGDGWQRSPGVKVSEKAIEVNA